MFAQIVRKGFLNVRVDEQIMEISPGLKLDRYKTHDIEIVIDRLKAHKENEKRMLNSLQQALKDGDGVMMVLEKDKNTPRYFSRDLMCPTTGIAYKNPEPNSFPLTLQKELVNIVMESAL